MTKRPTARDIDREIGNWRNEEALSVQIKLTEDRIKNAQFYKRTLVASRAALRALRVEL